MNDDFCFVPPATNRRRITIQAIKLVKCQKFYNSLDF